MRRTILTFSALFVLGAASVSALAQEDQPGQPADDDAAVEDTAGAQDPAAEDAAPEPAEEAQNAEAESGAPDEADGEEADGDAATAAPEEDEVWEMPALPDDFLEDDVFIPTEEISADEEVTFPVNI